MHANKNIFLYFLNQEMFFEFLGFQRKACIFNIKSVFYSVSLQLNIK